MSFASWGGSDAGIVTDETWQKSPKRSLKAEHIKILFINSNTLLFRNPKKNAIFAKLWGMTSMVIPIHRTDYNRYELS